MRAIVPQAKRPARPPCFGYGPPPFASLPSYLPSLRTLLSFLTYFTYLLPLLLLVTFLLLASFLASFLSFPLVDVCRHTGGTDDISAKTPAQSLAETVAPIAAGSKRNPFSLSFFFLHVKISYPHMHEKKEK